MYFGRRHPDLAAAAVPAATRISLPTPAVRVHLRCALGYKADATGTWFAAEELIGSSSPSLNLFCLLLLLQSHLPWPEPRTWHTDYRGLAISLCLCKRKIYHCWFDQTFLGHEIESKEQAKLLLNAQYGIEAQTCQGFFLDSFFPGALSVTFSFWKTLLSELVEPKRCRFFYQSGTKSLLVSQRHSCKAEQQLGNVTGWRQRSLCPSSASKKSALKVTLEQNINHQRILQCEEPHYWIHDDQLKNLKDKYLALQFMPLVTSSASWNCNWWVTLSPI